MQIKIVQAIVKVYFVAAIAASFVHIIEAAHKIGLGGWEAWSTPFMIDGLAIVGMIMRGASYSKATRKIGFRVQIAAGSISLIANVYAADNLGGRIYGVAIIVLFLTAEWLADKIESAEAEQARQASKDAAAKRSAAATKAAQTRKRNATAKSRKRKAQTKILEEMIAA